MNTKKILSLIVAVAMIVAVVPAFGLVASAAEASDFTDAQVLALAKNSKAVFDAARDMQTYSGDGPIDKAWEGWSGEASADTALNVNGSASAPRIQFYTTGTGNNNNGNTTNIGTVTMPSYGSGSDYIVFSFKPEFTAGWGDVALVDSNNTYITGVRFGTENNAFNVEWGHNGWANPFASNFTDRFEMTKNGNSQTLSSGNNQIDIVLRAISDSQYTAAYFLDGAAEPFTTVTYNGSFSDINTIKMSRGNGGQWARIAILSPVIYAGDYPETVVTKKVTVKYMYGDEEIAEEVLEDMPGTTVTAPAKDGNAQDGTAVSFAAATFTVGDEDTTETVYPYAVGNLVAHYDFADGDAKDSVAGLNGTVEGSQGVTFDVNGYVTFPGGDNSVGYIKLPADVIKNLTGNFTVSMWVKQDSSYNRNGKAIAFWDFAVGNYDRLFWQQAANAITIQNRYGDARGISEGTSGAMKDNWALLTAVFDLTGNVVKAYIDGEETTLTLNSASTTWSTAMAPANLYTRANGNPSIFLGHNWWGNGDNPELKGDMADVRIYNKALTAEEVAALKEVHKVLTVSYKAGEEELKESTTVDYFTKEATFEVDATIEKDGAVYKLVEEGTTKTASGTEYTVEYAKAQAEATGVEKIADVTVIDGNAPVLPKQVKLLTDDEAVTYTADVTWDTADLTVGPNEVKGEIEGYDFEATVNVTVLACTDDSLANAPIIASNGQNADAVHDFNAVKGDVTFEFDAKFNKLVNSTITIGEKPASGYPIFGGAGDAISIQTNANGLSIRDWNGSTAEHNYGEGYVSAGNTYRFFITTDTNSQTYSVKITDADGKVVAEHSGIRYRKSAAKLDVLVVLDNSNTSEAIEITNFRVSWADAAQYKDVAVKYVTEDGTEIVTTAVAQYKIGDTISIAESKVYADGKIYTLPAVEEEVTAATAEVIEKTAEVAQAYAATKVAHDPASPGGQTTVGGYVAVAGKDDNMSDADGVNLTGGSITAYGNARYMDMTFNTPELAEGQVAILHIAAGGTRNNNGSGKGYIRLRVDNGSGLYAYTSEAWTDADNNDNAFATPEYKTADITDIVKAAAGNGTFSVKLATGRGAVGLVNEDQSAWGGKAQGYASYIEIVDGVKITNASTDAISYITVNGTKRAFVSNELYVYPDSSTSIVAYGESGSAVPVMANDEYKQDGKVVGVTEDTTLSVAPTGVPEITAELGWNEAAGAFAINFLFVEEDFKPVDGFTYGVDIFVPGKAEAVASATIEDGGVGVGVSENSTNVPFRAKPWFKADNGETKTLGEVAVDASIYGLLAADIEESEYKDGEVDETIGAAAVEVFNKGGIFVTGDEGSYDVTAEMKKIAPQTADKTYTLSESAKAVGLAFTTGMASNKDVSGESADAYDTIKINEDGTVTLSGEAGLEAAITVYLEDVELVFIPEVVVETETQGDVSNAADFQDIL